MTNATQQESNDVKLVKLIPDLSGLATKLPDYYKEHEMREFTVKRIKSMLDNLKIALSKQHKDSSELYWFNDKVPLIKRSLSKCLKVRISKHDLDIHGYYASDELREIEQMAEDLDAKCAK